MSGLFSQRVWDIALSIPPGRVTTYGALARAAGGTPILARSITSILGKAPNQGTIPYHRIVYADGRVWLPDEPKAQKVRLALYRREDIIVDPHTARIKNFDEVFEDFR